MTAADDEIPTDGFYRGVPLHAGQSEARLAVVRHDIDRAHELQELEELVGFADEPGNAPESRLLAQAKALATLDDRIERRAPRTRAPELSRERIIASTTGCDSLHWRNPWYYGSLLDRRGKPSMDRRVPREKPLLER